MQSPLSFSRDLMCLMSTLQDRVEEAIAAGFKPGQLAKATGKTSSAVSQWRSGETKSLSIDSALGLERLTGWRAEWWATGKPPRSASTPTNVRGVSTIDPPTGYIHSPDMTRRGCPWERW